MLHRHLTVAFRALDRKWGEPVDLDTTEDSVRCVPAVVDEPSTTFSSEEYLSTIRRRRPKPYDREKKPRKSKLKDSFSNISLSRYPSSDLGASICSLEPRISSEKQSPCKDPEPCEHLMEEMASLVANLKKPLEEPFEKENSKKSALKRKKEEIEKVLKRVKDTAFSYIERRYQASSNFCN